LRLAQQARDACECLEVISARMFGREQQEDQVHRLVVQRFELDGFIQASEQAHDLLQAFEFYVWDSDSSAEAGRAKAFPLQEGVEEIPCLKRCELGSALAQLLKRLLLALRLQGRNDAIRRQQVPKIHDEIIPSG